MKPIDSQQVESKTTNKISQQVESDATSPSLDRSVSFEIIPAMIQSDATSPSLDRSVSFEIIPVMTQNGDNVVDQDADVDDEDPGQAMGDVLEFIAIESEKSPRGGVNR